MTNTDQIELRNADFFFWPLATEASDGKQRN